MKVLSETCRNWMRWMGNFGPTVRVEDRTIKGYMVDPEGDAGKEYMTSHDLRELSKSCVEMADWLDARASEQHSGGGA